MSESRRTTGREVIREIISGSVPFFLALRETLERYHTILWFRALNELIESNGISLWLSMLSQVSNRSSVSRVEKTAEGAGAGSYFMVLKCLILHAPSSPSLISVAFLSESTPRSIRVGIKLAVINVSDPRIIPKFLGKFTLHGSFRILWVGEIPQVKRWVYVHDWESTDRNLKVNGLEV